MVLIIPPTAKPNVFRSSWVPIRGWQCESGVATAHECSIRHPGSPFTIQPWQADNAGSLIQMKQTAECRFSWRCVHSNSCNACDYKNQSDCSAKRSNQIRTEPGECSCRDDVVLQRWEITFFTNCFSQTCKYVKKFCFKWASECQLFCGASSSSSP